MAITLTQLQLKPEWHSLERIHPPRPLMSQNSYH